MRHDSRPMLSRNNGEPGTAPQSALHESSSSVFPAGESPLRTLRVSELVEQCRREIQASRRGEPSNAAYGLELVHRAIMHGDQDAWAGLQQCLSELVRGWLRGHPRREAALRWESEESYVALAFERFWQATVQQQVVFRTFTGALAYLRASLNGALLDTLRAYMRPREVALPELGAPGEPFFEDRTDSGELCVICSDYWLFGSVYASQADRHFLLHKWYPNQDHCSIQVTAGLSTYQPVDVS